MENQNNCKYQNCIIIPPGHYSKLQFNSDKCYVCNGNLKLIGCVLQTKLFVVGNFICNNSILSTVDINGLTILKNTICNKDIFSFLGGNFFNSSTQKLISHGNVYGKDINIEHLQVHGNLQLNGKCNIKRILAYN